MLGSPIEFVHRTNKFKSCLGSNYIVYAWNVAALTGPFVEPGDQFWPAVSLGLAATSERKVVICGHWLGQVVGERLWV